LRRLAPTALPDRALSPAGYTAALRYTLQPPFDRARSNDSSGFGHPVAKAPSTVEPLDLGEVQREPATRLGAQARPPRG